MWILGTYKKTLTMDCLACEKMEKNDMNQMLCAWGKKTKKVLEPQKGKKPLMCNLIKEKK